MSSVNNAMIRYYPYVEPPCNLIWLYNIEFVRYDGVNLYSGIKQPFFFTFTYKLGLWTHGGSKITSTS